MKRLVEMNTSWSYYAYSSSVGESIKLPGLTDGGENTGLLSLHSSIDAAAPSVSHECGLAFRQVF